MIHMQLRCEAKCEAIPSYVWQFTADEVMLGPSKAQRKARSHHDFSKEHMVNRTDFTT